MKLALAFLLLIGATFQITPSAGMPDNVVPIESSFSWRDFINNSLQKATIGMDWINGQLGEMRTKLNSATSQTNTEIQNGATMTVTKTEQIITSST